MKNKTKVNVIMRDGTEYLGRSAPGDNPFSDQRGTLVRFYGNESGTSVIIVPIDLVARLEVYQENV